MIDNTLSTVLSRLTYSEQSLICGVSGVAKSTLERAARGANVRAASAERIWAALVKSGLAERPQAEPPAEPGAIAFEVVPVPEAPNFVTDLYLRPSVGSNGWQVLLTTRVPGERRPVYTQVGQTCYPTPNAAAEAGLKMQAEIEAQYERNRDPRLSPSVFLNQGGGAQ